MNTSHTLVLFWAHKTTVNSRPLDSSFKYQPTDSRSSPFRFAETESKALLIIERGKFYDTQSIGVIAQFWCIIDTTAVYTMFNIWPQTV